MHLWKQSKNENECSRINDNNTYDYDDVNIKRSQTIKKAISITKKATNELLRRIQ